MLLRKLNKISSLKPRIQFAILLILVAKLPGCSSKDVLFTVLEPEQTGISFENKIIDSDSFNILDYLYFYNGGGVAVGDINNDGLQDIYLTSNQASNKLYLNKGDFKFEDITTKAGVEGKGNWKTGVTMADVNGDGLLDIYVSEVGKYKTLQGRNELFINNGDNTFKERAKEFGLDIEGFNTQACFFDYDKDGDLDAYIVNHSVHSTATYVDASERNKKSDVAGDKLMRCDRLGDSIFFKEVTEEAGLYSSVIGYGLNVIAGDFNNDNWEDLYVSNDFHENDYYYLNNQDGTFRETVTEAFGHTSRFSMGSDAGDINNDGWLDLVTLDMLPTDEQVLKSSASDDDLDIYEFKRSKGYHHQYSKNCLQLNIAAGKKFSDISLYAGVAATDWSWSPLLGDFDNDGIKDLFITNGVLKRPNDLDYIKFVSSKPVNSEMQKGRSLDPAALEKMPHGAATNVMFKGTKDMKFIDQSTEWGFTDATLSNGAAYADFDNDGDLDIVVNNINAQASLYENNSPKKDAYLKIQLKGDGKNTFGYGSKLILKNRAGIQLNYVTATRGFQSASVDPVHFGLGENTVIDTLQVIWTDGKIQTLTNIAANQQLILFQKNAQLSNSTLLPGSGKEDPLFINVSDSLLLDYRHVENRFNDFNVQQLIPHEVSTQGPGMAVADINGDSLDDIFIGGAKGQAGKLFTQTENGRFVSTNKSLFEADMHCEDVNAAFFDVDGDKDNDLYVVSGGNEREGKDSALLDRLYVNDGNGNFVKSKTLPPIFGNKSVAVPCDMDGDGDLDLFVGGRVVAGRYGLIPQSYLLVNDGKGTFKIAGEDASPGLRNIGMVTGAVWTDIDRDGWEDLVIAGEWMPITIYKNVKGKLQNVTDRMGLANTTGLWTTVSSIDLDNDGFEELLAGNWGENSKLSASQDFPLQLYVGDIDMNGSVDQLMVVSKHQKYYSFLGKEEIEKALPSVIRKKYLDYKSMAGQTIETIFKGQLSRLTKLSAKTLSSVLIENDKGKLSVSPLPSTVQWSPIFSFITGDFNRDGKTDILAAGNFYGVLPYEGRYDANYGSVLLQNEHFYQSVSSLQSGLLLEGEIRDIKKLRTARGMLYFFARNDNRIIVYKNQKE